MILHTSCRYWTFIKKQGFTWLHTPVFCRWFDIDHERVSGIKVDDPNPDWRTFDVLETIILKTYAASGTMHLWILARPEPERTVGTERSC